MTSHDKASRRFRYSATVFWVRGLPLLLDPSPPTPHPPPNHCLDSRPLCPPCAATHPPPPRSWICSGAHDGDSPSGCRGWDGFLSFPWKWTILRCARNYRYFRWMEFPLSFTKFTSTHNYGVVFTLHFVCHFDISANTLMYLHTFGPTCVYVSIIYMDVQVEWS